MADVAGIFARLAALRGTIRSHLSGDTMYFDPPDVLDCFARYERLVGELRRLRPELYSDVPARRAPGASGTIDNEGRGYIDKRHLSLLLMSIEEVFELRAQGEGGEAPRRIFISHGRSPDWYKVQAYIEKDINVETLELAQEANRGRTVLQKLEEEARRCSYAVIVMTGDDRSGDGERPRARENVMHEIGFFQGRYGLANVCLLYEEGTSVPSNIHGLAYVPYPGGLVETTFGPLRREIESALTRRDER
jgi:hypothetical protein